MKVKTTGRWWAENLLRPMLIAGMLACMIAPLVLFLEWLFEGWDGSYFFVFVFLASLEGILSERALRKQAITGYGYLASRAAEVLLLLLALKFFSYISLGLDQLWTDAQLWSTDPGSFFAGVDSFLSLIFLPTWAVSLYVARVVRALDVEARTGAPPPDKTSTAYYLWETQPAPLCNRQAVLDWLGEIIVWGGIALLAASAATHFLLSSAWALAVPTVLYFVLGIALLGQGRFSVLHAGWQTQGIPVQADIARRWLLWAIIFLLGVAAVALVLPTEYTVGPLRAILGLFGILVNIVSFLLFLLLFLIALPLALIFPSMGRPALPSFGPEQLPPREVTGGGAPPWLDILLSALFWLTILAIVSYAAYRFYQDRFGSLPDEELETTWWGQILAWLRHLWRRWRNWRLQVQTRLEQRRARRAKEKRLVAGGALRFFFPWRLPPRELIRYFYLSIVRRAAQAGQSRRPGQTPYEYQADLDQRFPDLEPDLGGLTEAFVEARYSPQPVQAEDANAVKPLWQRIKAALRRRRASSQ